jgi:phthiocerol/phenolphthiocerol synthesis type-I polyketide synthase E
VSDDNGIAIIGMAGRFPGSPTVGRFWSQLRSGREGITRFTPDVLIAAGVDPELVRRPDYVAAKGVLTGVDRFDWTFFGYSRAEAATIDPQQRIFLECAAEAIDDAAIDPERFGGWIGVYAGADATPTVDLPDLDPLIRTIGREKDFLATRVAYKLGLRGPAVTVQTACSTSLTAVHAAVQSLLCFECDAALAGGVSVTSMAPRGYLAAEGSILSPDGHCRPFDSAAAGTVPAEGVGVVVLRRLADALADGDDIRAVIHGSAVNNDGDGKVGFTAPSVAGQREVIRMAQKLAQVDPARIAYVEAHGTATPLGDPVEIQALADVFDTVRADRCRIGSVKSNIGHTGAAAGVAGLIKTVLMLRHGWFVPTLHFQAPNPMLHLEKTPFDICVTARPWPDSATSFAGVSSFGVGGTNVHVIVGGAPPAATAQRAARPRLLAMSAASPAALARTRTDLADFLAGPPGGEPGGEPGAGPGGQPTMDEVADTLAQGRRRRAYRQVVVAEDRDDAIRRLRAAPPPPVQPPTQPRTAFLFPGQGVLRRGSLAGALACLPEFRDHLTGLVDRCRRDCGVDLRPMAAPDAPPAWFTDTVHQQLGLFVVGCSLGRQLVEWGVHPDAMLGNSVGEYVAATLSGLWDVADGMRLVHTRARAMRATAPGRMAALDGDVADERIVGLLGRHEAVTVAVDGPGSTVVAGPPEAMTALLADPLTAALRPRALDSERAFHTSLIEPALDAVRAAVEATPAQTGRGRIASTVTGSWIDADALRSPDYWAEQLRRRVRLTDAMTAVLDAECDVLVELGPGASMTAGARRHPRWADTRLAVAPLGGSAATHPAVLEALGAMWVRGMPVPPDPAGGSGPGTRRCGLPPHPLDSRPVKRPAEPVIPAGPAAEPSTLAVLTGLWCDTLGVSSVTGPDDFEALGGESLHLVHLVNRVNRRLGTHIAVAEFARAPTFDNLAGLVGTAGLAGTAGTGQPGVVALNGITSGTPLFLAADALGTTAGYRALAGLLRDRPVFGLEPVTRRGQRSVTDIAAEHVDHVRRLAPQGPYLVGGWSFGAAVAHEMARLLTARGAAVDTLVCIDGHVPATRGRALRSDRRVLAATVGMQLAAGLRRGVIGALVRDAPQTRRLLSANLAALRRLRPAPVPCRAVLLTTRTGPIALTALRDRVGPLYRETVVDAVPGDHWSMLAEPHVGDLAAAVRRALRPA